MEALKPKLAVWKFASCDGCQLALLDLEDELVDISRKVEISYFLEASTFCAPPPYDISLVEGSIVTEHDIKRIQEIRQNSTLLVAIGACATSGGVQALRNKQDIKEMVAYVYPHPEYISTLPTSLPASAYVHVDYQLRGCPINKRQLLELFKALLAGRRPQIPTHSLCMECKLKGNVCLMVAEQIPCLGPITQAGCGAVCPSTKRGCFGCFGPQEDPNVSSLEMQLRTMGIEQDEIDMMLQKLVSFRRQDNQ